MSKSFIAGSVAGAALSVVTAASLSLLATPGGSGADQPVAAPEAVAEQAPPPEPPKAAEAAAPSPDQPDTATESEPALAAGDVPQGSEFAQPKEDGATDLPAADTDVAAEAAPEAPPVQAEPAPALADTAPAAQPAPTEAPDAPAADTAKAEPAPAAPEPQADEKLALATEQAPDLPEAVSEPVPAVDSTTDAAEPTPAPTPEPAPQPEPTPEPAPAPQPEPAEAPSPEPAPQPSADEQAIVVVPDTGDDDAPGPVSDPEVDAQIPLDPPPPDGGGGGAADGEGGEGADGEAAPDAKPALAVSPGAKFVKVAPSQQTTELASNEASSTVKVNRPDTSGGDAAAGSFDVPATAVPQESPIRRFGASFSNPDGKPVLALVILDRGVAEGGLDPSAIAALPFPVTVALDPSRADAAEAAALYRKAGAEVVLMASDLPQGATPADLEVAYQAYVSAVPEAIGLLGGSRSEIQRSSLVAQHVAALLKADGRGMITYDQGLNPGRRAAETLGVPTAAIERVYGTAEDNSGTLTRELDRAAFTAGQRGRLVIAVPSTPEAVTGLVAWAAGPGAAGVAIAPISAVMLGQTVLQPPPAPVSPSEEPAPPPEESTGEPAPAETDTAPEGADSY